VGGVKTDLEEESGEGEKSWVDKWRKEKKLGGGKENILRP